MSLLNRKSILKPLVLLFKRLLLYACGGGVENQFINASAVDIVDLTDPMSNWKCGSFW